MSSSYDFDVTDDDKARLFQQACRILFSQGFRLIDTDITKPWGFYLSVDESQSKQFIESFYKDAELKGIDTSLPLRPKFLGIAPQKRLSWQYHHRRSEVWRCLAGEFNLVTSQDDNEGSAKIVKPSEIVSMSQGVRHRGVGLQNWALVAEIWQHTDPANPSDEQDIVRVQDDFGR